MSKVAPQPEIAPQEDKDTSSEPSIEALGANAQTKTGSGSTSSVQHTKDTEAVHKGTVAAKDQSSKPTHTGTAGADTQQVTAKKGDKPGIKFTLSATNNSSLSGKQYFNVYPTELKIVPPGTKQIGTALVSPPTDNGATSKTTWTGGPTAMSVFAMLETQTPDKAERTPVTLGATVTITYADGAFKLVVAPGSEPDITVVLDDAMPNNSYIGLVNGPAPVLIPADIGPKTLKLTPDTAPKATVTFGTPYQWPNAPDSDLSNPQEVTFNADDTSAKAKIVVDLDNLIRTVS